EPDALGDLGEPDAGEAAPGEQALGAVQDLVAGGLPELRDLRRHRPSVRYRLPDRSVGRQAGLAAAIRTRLSHGDRDMTTSLLLCGSVYAALGLLAAARCVLRPMRAYAARTRR